MTIGKRLRIIIGARYSGQRALTVITGTRCDIFINGRHIRGLTIDATRRVQPLNPPAQTKRKAPRHA